MTLMYWTNYSKRLNSTAYPTGGTVIDVKLKNGTSILNPSLLLELPFNTASSISYVLWNTRYYFVQNVISYTNTIVELVCGVDVLATYKSAISTYSCYVERTSDSNYYDIFVNDSSLSSQYNILAKKSRDGQRFPNTNDAGCFLLRTVGKAVSFSSIGITTYAISAGSIKSVLEFLFSEDNFDFLSDTSVKSFFNPFQYIIDCRWTPFSSGAFGRVNKTVTLGWWDTGIEAIVVTETGIEFESECVVPQSLYTDFRQYNPRFSQVKLTIPTVGVVDVNAFDLLYGSEVKAGYNVFNTKYQIDVATGETWIDIRNGENVVGHYVGSMFTQVAIGQMSIDGKAFVQNRVGAVGDALSFNISGAINRWIDGIENVTQPTTSYNGSAGNVYFVMKHPFVTSYRIDYGSKQYAVNNLGRPCCLNLTLGSLSGYIQCAKASCPISGTESEKSQLNSYLNGGFYYE